MRAHRMRLSQVSGGPDVGSTSSTAPCAYSEEPGMRLVGATLVATVLALACAACSGNAEEATPSASPTPTTVAPSTSASPTAAPYLESYSADERAAYAEPVAAYETTRLPIGRTARRPREPGRLRGRPESSCHAASRSRALNRLGDRVSSRGSWVNTTEATSADE